MNWAAYEKPKDVLEALAILEHTRGRGRVIAGGTDLILQLKRGEYHVDSLVDITGIHELGQIREENGWVRIGAGVTHAQVAKSRLIQREAMALAQGCGQVGSPQIRNIGTLVGNVISAQPAADGAIPLMALEAEMKVLSKEGERWIPTREAYQGLGLSAVDSTKEIAVEVRFRKSEEHRKTSFFRMASRKALTLPILNGAVAIVFNPLMDQIERARIAIGPVAERPFRAVKAEFFLESRGISNVDIFEAARIASEEANPRTSRRGSASYRKEMIRVNLIRTIGKMLDELRKRKESI